VRITVSLTSIGATIRDGTVVSAGDAPAKRAESASATAAAASTVQTRRAVVYFIIPRFDCAEFAFPYYIGEITLVFVSGEIEII
jgi:hypothetical protein